MPNGPQPREPEEIHILPEDFGSLPEQAQLSHMGRMTQSYLQRLFYHVYNVEHILSAPESGVLSRLQSQGEYVDALRDADAIENCRWAGERKGAELKIVVGIIIALILQSAAVIYAVSMGG